MMSREEIRQRLLADATWQPAVDAPDEVWDMYDEVYEEMLARGEIQEDGGEGMGDVDGEEWDMGDDEDGMDEDY